MEKETTEKITSVEPDSTPIKEPLKESTKSKKSFPKWIIIVFLFIIVAIASFAGYLLYSNSSTKTDISKLTPTPKISPSNENLSWQTYTNKKYGYSIDYPKNWNVREFPETKTGAAFTKSNKPDDYQNETITINSQNKTLNNRSTPFEEYVKIAASQEIQNYKSLKTIKKIKTDSGIIGYETTWTTQSIANPQKGGESLPITYFEIPGDNTATIQVTLGDEKDLETYEKMLTTFSYNKVLPAPTNSQVKESYLMVPQLGVKMLLSENIKDAYVVVPKEGLTNYVYLKVHSLDSEPACNKDESSTAAMSKVNKDELHPMSGKPYSDSYQGVTIGNYFYYISLAQYSCAETGPNATLLEKVRQELRAAAKNITLL